MPPERRSPSYPAQRDKTGPLQNVAQHCVLDAPRSSTLTEDQDPAPLLYPPGSQAPGFLIASLRRVLALLKKRPPQGRRKWKLTAA